MLIDKTSDKPLMERTYVPCPHCKTLHDGRTWSKKNGTAFKNWFGYYCPECGSIIPCLRNTFAWLLLAVTFPLWGWFKDDLKQKWIDKQPRRYENIEVETISYKKVSRFKIGVRFGSFMSLFIILFQIIQRPSHYLSIIFATLPACILGVRRLPFVMKYWMGHKGKTAEIN